MKSVMLPLILVNVLAFGGAILIHRGQVRIGQFRTQYEAEIERLEAANQRQTEQDLAEHKVRMADSDLISGNRAREAHEEEWTRRCQYDPAFAQTAREKAILEIAAISKDKSLSAQDILQRAATLAAPEKSTVEVAHDENGFRVVVTFDMSVMTSGEEGSRTKHLSIESLKREVVEIISRVLKDMYDHCGKRGIQTIAIACTHGVEVEPFIGFQVRGIRQVDNRFVDEGLKPYTTVETKTIHRCSVPASEARKVSDWRSVPLHKVADLLQIEHDEFPHLKIVTRTVPGFGW